MLVQKEQQKNNKGLTYLGQTAIRSFDPTLKVM